MATITYSFAQTKSVVLNSFTSGTQSLPEVLGLSNGGFVSAYNGGGFILLDFFDANQNIIGSFKTPYNDSTNTSAPGQPSLTQLANGNIVVTWYDSFSGDTGIKASIYTPNGAQIAAEIDVGNSIDVFNTPTVTALNNGNFVVGVEFSGNIFFNVLNSSGGTVQFYTQANTVTAGTQNDAQIVALADGGFAVTWTDTNPADQLIKGRIYNADGTARTGEFLVADFGDNTQSSLVALENGNFAVAYTDSGWVEGGTLGNGISLQIVTPSGGLVNLVHVNTTSTGDEVDPDVTILDNGFIMVTWTHSFSATDQDIYAAVFDQAGNRILLNGLPQRVITSTSDADIRSSVSGLLDGKVIVGWQDGSSTDIQGAVMETVRTTTGDATAETLTGDELRDIIFGGGGSDFINGGTAKDELHGEAGDDTITISQAQTATGIIYDGGVDIDTLRFSGSSGGYSYDLRDDTVASIEKLQFIDPGLNLPATVMLNASQFGGTGIASNAAVAGTSFSDVPDTLQITMGAVSSANFSTLVMTNFNQALDKVEILGDADVETITGTTASDLIRGGGGGDTLSGDSGNDTFYITATEVVGDTLNGGADNDTILVVATGGLDVQLGAVTLTSIEEIEYNTGNATGVSVTVAAVQVGAGLSSNLTIDFNGTGTAEKFRVEMGTDTGVNLSGFSVQDQEAADRIIILGDNDAETMVGTGGRDELYGSGGDDKLVGHKGADYLSGGAGSDTASYSTATAGVIASLANSAINTGDAAGDTYNSIENLLGTGFNDSLNGNAGANQLQGGAGIDTLKGYAGNDSLLGGEGTDTLIGGAGADVLFGGTGSDAASYADAASGVIASLANSSINTGDAAGDTYNSIERLIGSAFNDSLNGANVVNNTLRGGAGNDILKGYTGNDYLEGGTGQDIFVFNTALNASTNVDTILDFFRIDDVIQIDNSVFSAITVTGNLLSGYFKNIDTGAVDANDHIIYDQSTGDLFYDSNGSGAGGRTKFAQLAANTALNYDDFFVV